MQNDVSNAKLVIDPPCELRDIELCEKGVHTIFDVDDEGNPNHAKESWFGESHFAYYYCDNCNETWDVEDPDNLNKTWVKVKEHLSE